LFKFIPIIQWDCQLSESNLLVIQTRTRSL